MIQEEPLLTEGLLDICREVAEKEGALPHRLLSGEAPPLYIKKSEETRPIPQRPGSSYRGEPSQNDRAADHP